MSKVRVLYQGYKSLRDNHCCLFVIYLGITILCGQTKHLIKILYNVVKNLTKALFLCELHFSVIFTGRPLNHQRTNNQRINLLYNDVKKLTSILSCCTGPKGFSSNDEQ